MRLISWKKEIQIVLLIGNNYRNRVCSMERGFIISQRHVGMQQPCCLNNEDTLYKSLKSYVIKKGLKRYNYCEKKKNSDSYTHKEHFLKQGVFNGKGFRHITKTCLHETAMSLAYRSRSQLAIGFCSCSLQAYSVGTCSYICF